MIWTSKIKNKPVPFILFFTNTKDTPNNIKHILDEVKRIFCAPLTFKGLLFLLLFPQGPSVIRMVTMLHGYLASLICDIYDIGGQNKFYIDIPLAQFIKYEKLKTIAWRLKKHILAHSKHQGPQGDTSGCSLAVSLKPFSLPNCSCHRLRGDHLF